MGQEKTNHETPPIRTHTRTLVVSCLIFNLADKITTYIGLEMGLREQNPLMNQLVAYWGLTLGILAAFTIATVGIYVLNKSRTDLARWTLIAINGLYITTTTINTTFILAYS